MEYISGFSGMPFLAERAALTLDGYDIDTNFKNIINSIKNIEPEEVDIVSTYNTIEIDSTTDTEKKKKTFAIDVKNDVQFGNYTGLSEEDITSDSKYIKLRIDERGFNSSIPPINQGSDIYLDNDGELRMKNGWYHVTLIGYINNKQPDNEIRYIVFSWYGGLIQIDYDGSLIGTKYFNIGFDVYIPTNDDLPAIKFAALNESDDSKATIMFTNVTVFKIGSLNNKN